jgi:hypothetical protein
MYYIPTDYTKAVTTLMKREGLEKIDIIPSISTDTVEITEVHSDGSVVYVFKETNTIDWNGNLADSGTDEALGEVLLYVLNKTVLKVLN